MRRTLGLTAAIVVALAVAGYAQKPDFSGVWTLDTSADTTTTTPPAGGAGGGGGGRGGGGPMTIKQTADSLSIETQGRNGAQTRTYKLDGSETEITMGQMTAKASAKWDGSKLVITTKTDNGESTSTYSLDGGKLVVDSTGGRGPSKRVYKKTT